LALFYYIKGNTNKRCYTLLLSLYLVALRSFMFLSRLLLISAPLLLIACSSTPPPVKVEKPAPVIIKEEFAKVLEGNFRGQFSFGDGKGYFKACDANKEFIVDADASLRNIYEQITSKKYNPVYIEFVGEIVFPKKSNKKSDAVIRIDRVHHMALAKASLQCAKPIDNFLFKAKGSEPYWRLNIDAQKLFFATKASNQVYQVKDTNFSTTQINRVKSISQQGQRLNLVIQPNHCYDLKNKEYWGYSAKIDSVWGKLNGCGEPGWPIIEQDFTGYYLNKNGPTISNLSLNKNYSVEYSEQVGEKTVLKTGFWKSNSPDRVVIMLTLEGEKAIQEEFIFQRQGLALLTNKINKKNIVTYFDKQGLLFNKMNAKDGVESIVIPRINRLFTPDNINPETEIDTDIQKAVNKYFKIHRTDPKETLFSAVKYDLNGDGIKEAIVLLDWCSKNGCEMLVFEGTEKGYRFSSRVSRVHAPITISQNQHYLWQSLLIDKGEETQILNFDGISYPIHTRDLKSVNKIDYSTEVILFEQGKPTNWFPIKL